MAIITRTTLFKSSKLSIEAEVGDSGVLVRPLGVIDEDARFAGVLDFVKLEIKNKGPLSVLKFDLGEVKSMNSCGVREWLLFMEKVSFVVSKLSFANVAELFVDQANMISNLFGNRSSVVTSFQAPYLCSHCGKPSQVLLIPSQVQFLVDQVIPPPSLCKSCGGPMQFDSIEDEYFEFLKRRAA